MNDLWKLDLAQDIQATLLSLQAKMRRLQKYSGDSEDATARLALMLEHMNTTYAHHAEVIVYCEFAARRET